MRRQIQREIGGGFPENDFARLHLAKRFDAALRRRLRVLTLALANQEWDPEGLPAALRGIEPTPPIQNDLPEGVVP